MTAAEIINKYISFFESRGHIRIANAPLVPLNDPSTLFTSSGMQPLVPYLLGEVHPAGTKLVNVQNSFRAQDIEEIGDNRHTTFFRMLGNWSLGEYFKKEQLSFFFTFLTDKTEGLGLDPQKLYVTVFAGYEDIGKDTESIQIWQELFKTVGIEAKEGERIVAYGVEKNWWSRAGVPEKMPAGEPGGPDSEVFYDYGDTEIHAQSPWKDEPCHVNCDCGRYVEIGNSVFMQFQKQEDGSFKELPQKNVDFGGGLERLLAASEGKHDFFTTNLFWPIIEKIEIATDSKYAEHAPEMRIIADHLIAATMISSSGVRPDKNEQGYILRRLIRRSYDSINTLRGFQDINQPTKEIVETIIEQYSETNDTLKKQARTITNTILEEANNYRVTLIQAQKTIEKELEQQGIQKAENTATIEIPADLAFKSATTYGLGPTQLTSLGYTFDEEAYALEMKKHQEISRAGLDKKFRGGLADHEEKTVMGHTATHLLHQALRDVLGKDVHQTGSNITSTRVRFDFNYDKRLTDEEITKIQQIVNDKIKENLPVHFELLPTKEAYELGAIGLFMDTYGDKSKIYFIGDTTKSLKDAYSIEFCGGPHVATTGVLQSIKILKQENLGKNQKRLYAEVSA